MAPSIEPQARQTAAICGLQVRVWAVSVYQNRSSYQNCRLAHESAIHRQLIFSVGEESNQDVIVASDTILIPYRLCRRRQDLRPSYDGVPIVRYLDF